MIDFETWMAALESDRYKQGKRLLYDPETDSYCCLGVGLKEAGLPLTREDGSPIGLPSRQFCSNLPSEMLYKAPGWFTLRVSEPDGGDAHVDCLNDDGLSFKEIAARLRRDFAAHQPARLSAPEGENK